MAGKPNTDRILDLERESITLVARADNLKCEVKRIEDRLEATAKSFQELDKRSALLAEKVERLDKDLNELRSRRWEVWKIGLVCLLSLLSGFAANWVQKQIDGGAAAFDRK